MIDWLRKNDPGSRSGPERKMVREAREPVIDLGGTPVPIILRRHRTARRLTLRLAPDGGEVRLTLPRWAASHDAIAFAHARRDWLTKQRASIPQREPPRPGGTIAYCGGTLQLDWREGNPRRIVHDGDTLRVGGPLEGLAGRTQRWLEREALVLMTRDMEHYTRAAHLDPVPVALSRAQKRWGSCSDKQRIRINWRLVQAPEYVRRSVVAHEVAHLVHFDHGPDFHALLARIYDSKPARADAWLKAHGRGLYVTFG